MTDTTDKDRLDGWAQLLASRQGIKRAIESKEEFLTRTEAARLMRVNPRTLDKWKLPIVKIERVVLIRRVDLDAFVAGHVIMPSNKE